jgi:prophage tail gpP-like protein
VRAEAYNGDKKIFNGFVDRQVASVSGEEKSVFIYARSSAAVLVDNEALPSQYHRPSARQLWFHNAREFGFVTLCRILPAKTIITFQRAPAASGNQ